MTNFRDFRCVFGLLAVAVCVLGTGCVTAEEFARAIEPMLDGAARFAANSAGNMAQEAVDKKLGTQWSGGEIATATSGIIMGIYMGAKAALYAWNRDPKGEKQA